MPRLLPKGEKDEFSPVKHPFGTQVRSAINGGGGGAFVGSTERFGERFHAKGSSALQCRCQAISNVLALFIFIPFFRIFF